MNTPNERGVTPPGRLFRMVCDPDNVPADAAASVDHGPVMEMVQDGWLGNEPFIAS